MNFFNGLTLKNKIFVSCLGFTLIVSILIALFTRSLLITSLTNELQKRGVGIAQSVADSSRGFILTRNRAELTALAYDARLGNRKDIALYLLICDKTGQILAHTFTTGLPDTFKHPMEKKEHSAESIVRMRVGRHWVFHVTVPVKEGIYTIGSVQMGLNQQHIDSLIARLRLLFLSFLSVVSIIFFFLSHRLSLHITQPISSLIRYTDQLTNGDFNIVSARNTNTATAMPVDPGAGDDEISILTNSFINMAAKLKVSTDNLRESRKKYLSLFQSGPNPIFVIHKPSFEILDANPKATELFGYGGDELVGMNLLTLGHLKNDEFARHYPVGQSIVISSKVLFFKKNGESLFVNIHASQAEYPDKDVIIVAATDITELVEKDSQLIQASKMTNLEKMSAGIAHEINQPLNAIKMGSEYLCMMNEQNRKVTPRDLTTVLTEISTQVTRAAEIVGRLKTFSRKADFSRDPIDLNQCVRSVHKIIGRQIALQNISITLSLDPSLPKILAHNNRMEQVIFNLITNARDAVNERVETLMDVQQGKIEITSFSNGHTVALTVTDNGIGIKPGQMDNIFDSFFTTKEMGEGLGLGLPIIQGIIRDYNGTISVESTPLNSTCFKIQFPAQPLNSPQRTPQP